jgi:hypothetical protein
MRWLRILLPLFLLRQALGTPEWQPCGVAPGGRL